MKDYNSDSTAVLDRFARDKRKRTTTAERIERRPGPRRDADDTPREFTRRRASYNPNFTEDNRPVAERPRRTGGSAYGEGRPSNRYQNRSDGRYPSCGGDSYSGGYDGRRSDGEERSLPPYAKRPSGAPRYGGDRPANRYADRSAGFGGERPAAEERPARPYGRKPFGASKYGGKSAFGKPSSGNKKAGAKFGPKRPYGASDEEFRHGGRPEAAPKRYGAKPAGGVRRDARRSDERPKSYPRFNPGVPAGAMRLNRFIAQSGLCSRREADDYIQAGLVSVNGTIVTELGTKVLPTDEVKFNDSRVEGQKKVYLVLNKPKGYVTSLEDPHADKTVMDLVKGACEERIYPVGRLDKNSLGLLLFTNDGDLTRQLTHPSLMKKKVYQVSLDKPLTRADMDRIAEGITLEDGEIHADEIAYVKEDKTEIGIEIHSGRNRIVRRIFESLGYAVRKLDRVYYAGLTKKNLKRGAWRFLTREEVMRLKSGQYE